MRGEMKPAGAAQRWRRCRGVLVTAFMQGSVNPQNQPRLPQTRLVSQTLTAAAIRIRPPERKQAARAGCGGLERGVAVLKIKSRETNHFCSQVAETAGGASPRNCSMLKTQQRYVERAPGRGERGVGVAAQGRPSRLKPQRLAAQRRRRRRLHPARPGRAAAQRAAGWRQVQASNP